MSKITLSNIANTLDLSTIVGTANTNFQTIQTAFDNNLSRDGTQPNTMGNILDMNSNRIINLPAPGGVNDPVRLQDVTGSPTINLSITLAGDVTSPTGNGTLTTTIANGAVTNAKLAANSVNSSNIVNASVVNGDLATQANNTIKSNISGGVASPSDNTLSAVIDATVGSTQGSIMYRNATTWVPLLPGTAGQVLSSNGSSSNPSWVSVASTPTITPEQFGAVGNGVTDDTTALQSFLNAAANNSGVFTPGKNYLFNGRLFVKSNTFLTGYGATLTAATIAGLNSSSLNLTDATQGTAAGPSNVTIKGLTINGNATARRAGGAFSGVGNAASVYCISVSHIHLKDLTVLDSEGDGIYIGGDSAIAGITNYFDVEGCYVTGPSRNCYSVVGAQYGSYNNCIATAASFGAAHSNISNGWDFEPNGSTSGNKNVTCTSCTAFSCSTDGFGMHNTNSFQTNINWVNCYTESCLNGFSSGTAGSSVRIIGGRFLSNTNNFVNCAEAIASFP